METISWSIGITVIAALILAALLFIYLRNFKSVKSKFCTGLIVFAALLLVYNLGMIYFQTMVTKHCDIDVVGPIFILNVLEALGLGALLYITWKPCM